MVELFCGGVSVFKADVLNIIFKEQEKENRNKECDQRM